MMFVKPRNHSTDVFSCDGCKKAVCINCGNLTSTDSKVVHLRKAFSQLKLKEYYRNLFH